MKLQSFLFGLGFVGENKIYRNIEQCRLVEHALKRGEAQLTAAGALSLNTGKYTGRSPRDRFIVDSRETHDYINWGETNLPIGEEEFECIYARLLAYLKEKDLYIFDGFAGADRRYTIPIRFINEMAVQNLFVHNLFIRPAKEELEGYEPEVTVICAPGFKANPSIDKTNSEAFVILNIEKKIVIIGGTMYCGEMKKSIFTLMNYFLPQKGILPMHCSANVGRGGDTALFFGLSGTGKTTLSADPERRLIGDDEHGWSEEGIFNFEGGCYAKCINLSKESEPQIWNAIRFGTVLENVAVDEDGQIDFTSSRFTENTRAGYPIDFIPGAVMEGTGGHPRTILFLTADAFGVLPPISKLTRDQAMYHFMSGYTSKLAGTERGVREPQATFSSCFGEPFMPVSPSIYAEMLGENIDKHGASVYLINTGWIGGSYGTGSRMKLSFTRTMVSAAIKGELKDAEYEEHPIFKLLMPTKIEGIPDEILNPINTWMDKDSYFRTANELADKFNRNFEKFKSVPQNIKNAAPVI
jgi:phosphoenolpyruvate carboxykinase (ATP)